MKKALDAKNVKLVAIGHDVPHVEDFLVGNYFAGELYLDAEKKTYNALSFGRVNAASGTFNAFSSTGRANMNEGSKLGVKGDFKGDGFQLGGLLVIEKGGSQILYQFQQKNVSDNPSYEEIAKVLDLDPDLIETYDGWKR